MLHAEQTETVAAPIGRVFDYLADGENNPHWRDNVIEIQRTSENVDMGATYRQIMKGPGGRSIRGDYRITRYQRPHHLEFDVIAGPARPSGSFRLQEADGEETRITFTLEFQPRGLTRVLTPMIRKQMASEVTALTQLSHVLED